MSLYLAEGKVPQKSGEKSMAHRFLWWISLITLVGIYVGGWRFPHSTGYRDRLASSIGQIELREFDMVTSEEGRIQQILVRPGDVVTTGQVVVRIDTQQLEVELREALNNLGQALNASEGARRQLEQLMNERAIVVRQRWPHDAEVSMKNEPRQCSDGSSFHNAIAVQRLSDLFLPVWLKEQRLQDILCAQAEMATWKTKVSLIRSQLFAAWSAVITAQNTAGRLQSNIDALTLRAPGLSRVLQHYAGNGDRMARGSRVLRLLDLRAVNMTFSLSVAEAETLAIGTEVRVALDLATPTVLPAQISFIATRANRFPGTWNILPDWQPSPQVVVKAKISPEILKTCASEVVDGMTGRAYVRLHKDVFWPVALDAACYERYTWILPSPMTRGKQPTN